MNLKGLKVAVVGIARSGIGAALLLKKMGAYVYATDNNINEEIKNNADVLKQKHINFEIGRHTQSFVKDKDLIVISPGVERSSPVIGWARDYGVPVISELELGYLFCKGKILAVTGTNGKTTTASLIGEMIKAAGRPVVVCGNIGTPFCSRIPDITGEHYVVLEVSSFQLEWIDRFKPYISVILNVTDDHLDRHRDFDEYRNMKSRIFINQGKEDFLVLNYEDPSLKNLNGSITAKKVFFSRERQVEGVFVKEGHILLNMDGKTRSICSTDTIRLKGLHNLDNVMASVLVCNLIGLEDIDIIKGASSFMPLPHRFQSIGEIEGIEFINDSKATNVDATLKALVSLNKPAVLIAGGRDKEGNFISARDLIKGKVKYLILIGEARKKISDAMKGAIDIHEANSLKEAVEQAYTIATKGDAVLLSPMCASFDMFKDYTERGEAFIKAVDNLRERQCARHVS